MNAATPTVCQRCEGKYGSLTHRIEWKESYDETYWKPRVTYRCDECTRALYGWLNIPYPGNPAVSAAAPGRIVKDELVDGDMPSEDFQNEVAEEMLRRLEQKA